MMYYDTDVNALNPEEQEFFNDLSGKDRLRSTFKRMPKEVRRNLIKMDDRLQQIALIVAYRDNPDVGYEKATKKPRRFTKRLATQQ